MQKRSIQQFDYPAKILGNRIGGNRGRNFRVKFEQRKMREKNGEDYTQPQQRKSSHSRKAIRASVF